MAKNRGKRMVAQLLLLDNKRANKAADEEKPSPQQKAAKNRAITFKHSKYPETRTFTPATTTYPANGGGMYERNLLRVEWPIAKAQEYLEDGIKKYKIKFPMTVQSIYGVDVELTGPTDMSDSGRMNWVFYNKKPCLLRGKVRTMSGETVSVYDFEEFFGEGDT